MRFSTIITAYNRHELTRVHVKEAMNSTLVPDEIIVVNDHGTPDLRDMLKELKMKTKVIYAYILDDIAWNYTGARNLGACLSTGDYLVSEDNDNIPDRNLYAEMIKYIQENDVDIVLANGRPTMRIEDMVKYPLEEWRKHSRSKRPPHNDSFMISRDNYFKVKGYDEQFAGQYAWVCTEWTRRMLRAGLKTKRIAADYFTAVGEGTKVCECDKSKEERAKTSNCKDCKLLFRRRSYVNYELARKKLHIQPPGGILNFSYTNEVL